MDSILRSPIRRFLIWLDLDCHLVRRINSNQFDVNPSQFVCPILRHRLAMRPISISFVPCSNRCRSCASVDRPMPAIANAKKIFCSNFYNATETSGLGKKKMCDKLFCEIQVVYRLAIVQPFSLRAAID